MSVGTLGMVGFRNEREKTAVHRRRQRKNMKEELAALKEANRLAAANLQEQIVQGQTASPVYQVAPPTEGPVYQVAPPAENLPPVFETLDRVVDGITGRIEASSARMQARSEAFQADMEARKERSDEKLAACK